MKINLNNKNLIIGIITGTLYLYLPCFAEDIELPNPAKFEPAQIKTTAEINTSTSRISETRHVPATDIPIPEVVNTFFAPINEIPSESITDDMKELQPIKTTQVNSNKAEQQLQENPFAILNSMATPSEYKAKKNPTREDPVKQLKEKELPTLPDTNINVSILGEESTYSASATEEYENQGINYEGKTIAKVRFKGLYLVNEKLLTQIFKTHAGSIFNTQIIQDDLQNAYALGYFTDNMYVEPELEPSGDVFLTFVLEENVTVNKTEIEGNSVIAAAELLPLVDRLQGLPQNLNLINESIEKINQYYEQKGYILAKVTNVDDTSSGTLKFIISEGIISEIKIDGNKKTKNYIIERNILTQPGTVYNEEFIKKDLAKLYSTQIFDKVDRKIEPDPDKAGEYIVTVNVDESSPNNLSVGLGVDNALGGFGQISYNEKNLFGKNQKLSISGMLGSGLLLSDASIKNRMNWNLELNFFEPHFINENNTLGAKLFYRDLGSYQIPLAIERRWGFNTQFVHKVRGYDNLSTNLAMGYEYIHLKEGDLNKISQMYRASHVDFTKRKEQLTGGSFFNVTPGIKYSTLDDEDMPRKGIVAKANFMEAFGINNIKKTNGRLLGSITKYIPVAKKSTLLLGAKGGIKVHGNEMPEVYAFRLGGPYTIRGFRMNGVGTGESFLMASAELQTPIPFMDRFKYDVLKNLRVAFFMDAGRIFDPTITSTLYDRPLSAITGGVGLRINIPGMGPISVDYGLPVTNTGKYSSQHGYFTFGTGGLYDSYYQ